MKKIAILFSAFIISALHFSCKKDSTVSSGFYIKANVNGEEKIYTYNAKASYYYGDLTNTFYMSAFADADSLPCAGCLRLPAFSLSLYFRTAPVAAGTYTQSQPANSNVYGIYGTYNSYATYNSQAQSPFTINITSINDKEVSGTFSGKYFDSTQVNPGVTITNGKFRLPIE